jgi:uncharacterized phage-associated protein
MSKYDYQLNYTKLIKLIYLADRECLEKHGIAISGDTYCSMPQGVVLSGLYDFILDKADNDNQKQWNACFVKDGYNLLSLIKDDKNHDELSRAQVRILDDVDRRFHDKDCWHLVDDVIHKLPEWDKRAKELNTSFPLEKSVILKKLGRSDDEIDELISLERCLDEMDELYGVDKDKCLTV